ncbi:uncharacterized protein E0L32_007369 [Thyridium curvatum]|uniref:Uncharacterized protein n=1 Tax=Thyridium curvatum TaxID=1093900 RepID=A0A507B480_9PEZI|nr:uncharacterized protein E0L32_007369 [Thyridium curvatum]TPX11871.1 hypothetical protein E0L32_007369 [Thyridium curvatum]
MAQGSRLEAIPELHVLPPVLGIATDKLLGGLTALALSTGPHAYFVHKSPPSACKCAPACPIHLAATRLVRYPTMLDSSTAGCHLRPSKKGRTMATRPQSTYATKVAAAPLASSGAGARGTAASVRLAKLWMPDDVALIGPGFVERDPRVTSLVELGRRYPVRALGPLAADGQAEAEWVVLRAVGLAGDVQRDDLVPQHVVARRDVLRQPDQPAVVVVRQDVGRPAVSGGVEEAGLRDLEELELGLVRLLLVVREDLCVSFWSEELQLEAADA